VKLIDEILNFSRKQNETHRGEWNFTLFPLKLEFCPKITEAKQIQFWIWGTWQICESNKRTWEIAAPAYGISASFPF
jgi:hypothetical protein